MVVGGVGGGVGVGGGGGAIYYLVKYIDQRVQTSRGEKKKKSIKINVKKKSINLLALTFSDPFFFLWHFGETSKMNTCYHFRYLSSFTFYLFFPSHTSNREGAYKLVNIS